MGPIGIELQELNCETGAYFAPYDDFANDCMLLLLQMSVESWLRG